MAKTKTKRKPRRKVKRRKALVLAYWWLKDKWVRFDPKTIHPWWKYPIGSPEFGMPSNPNER